VGRDGRARPSASEVTSMREVPLGYTLATQQTLSRVESQTWRHAHRVSNLHVDVVGVGRVAATTQTGPVRSGTLRVDSCLEVGSVRLVALVNSRPQNARETGVARPGRAGARTEADHGVAPRHSDRSHHRCGLNGDSQTGRLLPRDEGARPGDRDEQAEIMHKSNYRGPPTKKYYSNAKFGQ